MKEKEHAHQISNQFCSSSVPIPNTVDLPTYSMIKEISEVLFDTRLPLTPFTVEQYCVCKDVSWGGRMLPRNISSILFILQKNGLFPKKD